LIFSYFKFFQKIWQPSIFYPVILTAGGNLDLISEKLPSAEFFSFPSPFTEKEQAFLKKAMKIHQSDNSDFKGRG